MSKREKKVKQTDTADQVRTSKQVTFNVYLPRRTKLGMYIESIGLTKSRFMSITVDTASNELVEFKYI